MAHDSRNPEVDAWFADRQHPIEATMQLARGDLETAVRAWCESR